MSEQNVWADISIVPPHPRLFFKRSDLPVLRQKAESPPCKALWEGILRRCERSRDISSLSLAYLMTGDVEFAERAKAGIWKVLEEPKWDDPEFLSVNHRLMSESVSICE